MFKMQMYDGVDYRYHHTDSDPIEGRAVAARVLGLKLPLDNEVLYDISLYSGGIGVLNRLAISIVADNAIWSEVTRSLRGRSPEEAGSDRDWVAELIWLFTGVTEEVALRPAATNFINEERRSFQTECRTDCRIVIAHESNVNDWDIIWGDDTRLNYLGYSQG